MVEPNGVLDDGHRETMAVRLGIGHGASAYPNPIKATQPYGALGGALLLGVVWAGWHLIPLLSAGRSLAWIAWWALGTVSYPVIIT